jgi:periplasmic divalent cation tolerance protein
VPAVLMYVTVASAMEALQIGRVVVEERLVACANVLPQMKSIFRWQGRVEEQNEAVLILKTMAGRANAVIERVRSLHSYTCPCIVVLPVDGGNPAFLAWIEEETAPA